MPTNRIKITVDLTHEEMADIRQYVFSSAEACHLKEGRKFSNTEVFALWVTLVLDLLERN